VQTVQYLQVEDLSTWTNHRSSQGRE